jgi:hypothetical protein
MIVGPSLKALLAASARRRKFTVTVAVEPNRAHGGGV